MKIVLGSQSPHKVKALQHVCGALHMADCQIVAINLSTKGWDQQPAGFEQTLKYAENRARLLKVKYFDAMCVGIENGLLRANGVSIDIAVIAVLLPDGQLFCSTSPGMQFPEALVQEAKKRGFRQTSAGQVIAEKFQGDPTDPHKSISNQKLDRHSMIYQGIYCLFLQLRGLDLL